MKFVLLQVHGCNASRALARLGMMHNVRRLRKPSSEELVEEKIDPSGFYVDTLTETFAKSEAETTVHPKSGLTITIKKRAPLDYQTFLVGTGAALSDFGESRKAGAHGLLVGSSVPSQSESAQLEKLINSILGDVPLCDVMLRLFCPQRVISVAAASSLEESSTISPALTHLAQILSDVQRIADGDEEKVSCRVCCSPSTILEGVSTFVETECQWELAPVHPSHCVQAVRIQSALPESDSLLFLAVYQLEEKSYVPPNKLHPSPMAPTDSTPSSLPKQVCRAQWKMWELHFISQQLIRLARQEAATSDNLGLLNLGSALAATLDNCENSSAPPLVACDVGASPGGWVAELVHRFSAAKVLGVDPGALDFQHEQCLHLQKKFEEVWTVDAEDDSASASTAPECGKRKRRDEKKRKQREAGNALESDGEATLLAVAEKSEARKKKREEADIPEVRAAVQQSILHFLHKDQEHDQKPHTMINVLTCDMNRTPLALVMMVKAMMKNNGGEIGTSSSSSSSPFLCLSPTGTVFFLTMKNTLKTEARFVACKNDTMQQLCDMLQVQITNAFHIEFKPRHIEDANQRKQEEALLGYGVEVHLFANTTQESTLIIALR